MQLLLQFLTLFLCYLVLNKTPILLQAIIIYSVCKKVKEIIKFLFGDILTNIISLISTECLVLFYSKFIMDAFVFHYVVHYIREDSKGMKFDVLVLEIGLLGILGKMQYKMAAC